MNSREFTENLKAKLEARFGQHFGGVIFKTPVCGTNLDSYGRGNVHNSKWQYRPKSSRWWNRPMPFPADLEMIENAFKKQKSFVFGFKSDPFMWVDLKYQVTFEVLKLAKQYGVHLHIETMSDLVAQKDYLDLLQGHSVTMQLGSGNDIQERIDSPGAPSPRRRLVACQLLADRGIHVELRYGTDAPDVFEGLRSNIIQFRKVG